jgi:hypothetical protein
MPPENIYQERQQGSLGALAGLALPIGVFAGHQYSTKHLASEAALRAPGRSILGGMFRGTEASKSANLASKQALAAFFDGKGWDFKGRLGSLNKSLSRGSHEMSTVKSMIDVAGPMTKKKFTYTAQHAKHGKVFMLGETTVAGKVTQKAAWSTVAKIPLGRTIAALARPALGLGFAWFSWASLIPPAIEGTIAGLGEMIRFGEKMRSTTPETSTHMRDMGTKEHAFTMRQAAAMAIHTSQTSTRAALGQEASFIH